MQKLHTQIKVNDTEIRKSPYLEAFSFDWQKNNFSSIQLRKDSPIKFFCPVQHIS
jgi:hypothetical protein